MKHDLNRNLQWRAKRLYALFACLVLTLPFAVVLKPTCKFFMQNY